MRWWLIIGVLLISCSKKDTAVNFSIPPSTYKDHQYKDKLTASEIVLRIQNYIPNAASFLHAQYDVTVFRIFYNTHDFENHSIVASGLVYVPGLPYYSLPVISYQHGTAIRRTEV